MSKKEIKLNYRTVITRHLRENVEQDEAWRTIIASVQNKIFTWLMSFLSDDELKFVVNKCIYGHWEDIGNITKDTECKKLETALKKHSQGFYTDRFNTSLLPIILFFVAKTQGADYSFCYDRNNRRIVFCGLENSNKITLEDICNFLVNASAMRHEIFHHMANLKSNGNIPAAPNPQKQKEYVNSTSEMNAWLGEITSWLDTETDFQQRPMFPYLTPNQRIEKIVRENLLKDDEELKNTKDTRLQDFNRYIRLLEPQNRQKFLRKIYEFLQYKWKKFVKDSEENLKALDEWAEKDEGQRKYIERIKSGQVKRELEEYMANLPKGKELEKLKRQLREDLKTFFGRITINETKKEDSGQ
jgi:hypothetical protein